MSPLIPETRLGKKCFPRMRGDEPDFVRLMARRSMFSPHARG